ncbi:MAG: 50S ribosomal protein L25 [Patescibacteria group bacterium]
MQIAVQKREKLGKKTKQLRRERIVPAVVFGKSMDSMPISIDYVDFVRVFKKAGETSLIDLKWENDNQKVLISEVQYHPVSGKIIHVNFHKVDLTEKITADIPVEVIGEEKSPIIKTGEGMLLTLLNTVAVEALPADLPSAFEVDVSGLTEVDAFITVGELNYDKSKITIVDNEDDDLVVKIAYAEMQEEAGDEVSEEELIASVEATEEEDEEEGADNKNKDKEA